MALNKPLETRVVAQGVPGRIQSKEGSRNLAGNRQKKLELVDGRTILADHDVDSGEVLHPIKAPPRLLAHREQLHPQLAFTHRLFHTAQACMSDTERTVQTGVIRLFLELCFQESSRGIVVGALQLLPVQQPVDLGVELSLGNEVKLVFYSLWNSVGESAQRVLIAAIGQIGEDP